MSADPSINALSASWGVLMRPATKTGLSETSLMACESGNVYPVQNALKERYALILLILQKFPLLY